MQKIMFALVLGLGIFTNTYAEGDAQAGTIKAVSCNACHGVDGISDSDIFPNLAGQHADYLIKQLKAFKEGTRVNALMTPMSVNLSEQDMQDLAAHFSSLERSNITKENTTISAINNVAITTQPINKHPIKKVYKGDVNAGQLKAVTCSACHGVDGNAVIGIYPKLAGQHEKYLTKQLIDFQQAITSNGKKGRVSTIMGGMTIGLSFEDIKNLAAYYASKKLSPSTTKPNKIGKELYFSGDLSRGITACSGCHSIDGRGMGEAGFPVIQSQNIEYLKDQLTHFKEGTRTNDYNNMMSDIAMKLSDEEIQAIAEFISSLK